MTFLKTPETIRKEYLYDPFTKFLNSQTERKRLSSKIKILQAPTGFGKTHALMNFFIPKIFEQKDKNLVIYAVPNVENIDSDKFILSSNEHNYTFTTDIATACRWIKNKKMGNVVLASTHAAIANVKKSRDSLLELKEQSAWFIEECHSWLGVTEQQWYEEVIGYATPKFEGTVYKIVKKVLESTDLCFGITATPTKQHRGKAGPIKFEIINNWCPVKDRLFLTKWSKKYEKYTGFNYVTKTSSRGNVITKPEIDRNQAKANLRKYLRDHHIANISALSKLKEKDCRIETKLTSLIVCGGGNNSRLSIHLDDAREMLSDMLIRNEYNPSSYWIAVMRDNEKGLFNLEGEFERYSEAEIIDMLNDPDSDVQFLLINNKGKAGINVFNLTGICSLRIRDPLRSDVTELSKQIIGRVSRLNSGHGDILSDVYQYNLEKMCRNYCDTYGVDEKVFYNTVKIANSFEFRYPSTPRGQWELSSEEYEKFYTASLDQVNDLLVELIFGDETCPTCRQPWPKCTHNREEAWKRMNEIGDEIQLP